LALVPRLAGDVFRFPPCVLLFPPDIIWEFVGGGGKNTDRKLGSAIPIRYGLCNDWDWEFPLVIWISDAVQTDFFREVIGSLEISSSVKAIISSSLSSIIWLWSSWLFLCWVEVYKKKKIFNSIFIDCTIVYLKFNEKPFHKIRI